MHRTPALRFAVSAVLLASGLAVTGLASAATPATGSSSPGSSSQAGSSQGGSSNSSTAATATSGGGEKVFQSAMPPCATCHQLKPGVNQPGPSLAGVATRAAQRIAAKDYKGKAKDAKAYIRESIMDPNAYIVPGQTYSASGKSLMPTTYAQALKPEQIDQLVSYLMTLK